MKRASTVAAAEAVVAVALWALSFILIKIALRELSPVTLIALRFAIAAAVIMPVAWIAGSLSGITRRDLLGLAILGAIGVTLHQFLQVVGQKTTGAGLAALCAATAPAFIVVLAALFLRERMGRWQVAGVGLAVAGAIVVSTAVSGWDSGASARYVTIGNLLVLLSAIVWAASTIIGKRMMRKRRSMLVTAGLLFFGWLFSLPFFIASAGWREIPGLSAVGWSAVVILGLFCTAVAHLANNHALKHISAQRVAVIQNLEPFLAVVGAWLILDERMTWLAILGGAAIVGGVYLTERFAAPADRGSPGPGGA